MASGKKKATASVKKPVASNGKSMIEELEADVREAKDKAAEKCGGKKGPKSKGK